MTAELLNPIERQSAVWMKLSAHIHQRIAVAQKQLENDQDETKTAKIRGRILALRALLSDADPQPEDR